MSVTTDKMRYKYYSDYANRGDVEAQYNLGLAYYNGDGVARNLAMARKWLDRAARNKHVEPQVKKKIEEMLLDLPEEDMTPKARQLDSDSFSWDNFDDDTILALV